MNFFREIFCHKLDILILLIFIWQWSYPGIVMAAETKAEVKISKAEIAEALPPPKVLSIRKVVVTAYSSTFDQTDSTPCLTANGFNLCENNEENVVAANFLPFGSKIRIPEYFGDRVFVVQDRMNARYYYRVDVWMKTRESALNFGIRNLAVEVIE